MEKFIKERESTKAMASKARNMAASRFEQGFVHKCLKDYYKEIMRVN